MLNRSGAIGLAVGGAGFGGDPRLPLPTAELPSPFLLHGRDGGNSIPEVLGKVVGSFAASKARYHSPP